ncbi:MAG: Rho GTPase activation protein [Olpidium bornovanus]|uniref:Rho GTPase activation protein n=1 Tax=Olpidium bornovanus TaxID=278681 RepID=A0A8H7ZTZ7_9FUNG|nr:MAG: Rho GTPase activation protein [Olpidium bornovanus]
MADATALSPLDDGAGCEEQEDEDGSQSTAAAPPRVPGLRAVVEQIDGTRDLERYVLAAGSTAAASAAAAAQGRGAMLRKADVLSHEYGTPARGGGGAASLPRPIFGVDLAEQLQRDEREGPPILVKCARAIEAHAIRTQGLYRISGSSAEVQALRALFDRNYDHVELTRPASGGSSTASAAAETEAGAGAVAGAGPGDLVDGTAGGAGLLCNPHSIAGVLKLYFRELPDPLLTSAAYAGFVDAARIADGAARVVAMHDRVNALPDANYATLRCLMRHLHAVQAHQRHNRMGVSNLGIIFGPTLMGSPPAAADLLNDMTHQCRVVETILENYRLIFEPDE